MCEITTHENTLHAMIAACPILQSLYIERNYYFHRVHIRSHCFVSVTAHVRLLVGPYNYAMDELIIVNVPSLEKSDPPRTR
jgi:hypothetical protein